MHPSTPLSHRRKDRYARTDRHRKGTLEKAGSHRIDKRIEITFATEPSYQVSIQRQARQRAMESLGWLKLAGGKPTRLANSRNSWTSANSRSSGQWWPESADPRRRRGARPLPLHAARDSTGIQRGRGAQRGVAGRKRQGPASPTTAPERENLLDTVWLATSGKQIKELWTKVAELLGDQPSPLAARSIGDCSRRSRLTDRIKHHGCPRGSTSGRAGRPEVLRIAIALVSYQRYTSALSGRLSSTQVSTGRLNRGPPALTWPMPTATPFS